MAESNELVIRVRSSGGQSRLVLSASSTVDTLRLEVAKHLQLSTDSIRLFTDPGFKDEVVGETTTLNASGLVSGSLIFVLSSDKPTVSSQKLCTQLHEQTEVLSKAHPLDSKQGSDASPSLASPTSSSPSSTPNGTPTSSPSSSSDSQKGFHKGDTNEPIFQSFDKYIKDRGFIVNDLPGNGYYGPVKLEHGGMTKVPPSVTLKHQPYRHVDHLELMNVEEIKAFVNYWRYELDMVQQRSGLMYGYYREDLHYPLGIRAVCEAIYEPVQESAAGFPLFLPDSDLEVVDKVAQHLGLERIGWFFTHLPRDQLLTSEEVVHIAKLQMRNTSKTHFTGLEMSKMVTCTISPDSNNGGEPVPNAFMVSDMGMALVRDGIIAEKQPEASHIQLRISEKGELLPQILEGGKETTKFDSDWFLVRVNESAPKKVRSIFKSTSFPRENRLVAQTPADITKHFASMNNKNISSNQNWMKFADFHLLLYVAKLFDIDTALTICDAIKEQKQVDPGLEEILQLLG